MEEPAEIIEELPPRPPWWRNWKVMLPLWFAIGGLVWLGLHFNVDHQALAAGVVLIGLVSHAFAWLMGVIALVPVLGIVIGFVLGRLV
jgi:hypothetical protein